ncbi:hypothetical protein A8F54_15425 [Burkholderia cenocepacia]|nr:hypothetical protein A8F54_15425 [Burkholderia cenocepacia]
MILLRSFIAILGSLPFTARLSLIRSTSALELPSRTSPMSLMAISRHQMQATSGSLLELPL